MNQLEEIFQNQYKNQMEFQQDMMSIDVFIIDQVSKDLHKIKKNQTQTLKIVIEWCKQQKKIKNYKEEIMIYVEIGEIYYFEGEEKNLLEITINNVSQINIFIFKKPFQYQLSIVFNEMDKQVQLIRNYNQILFSYLDQYEQKLLLLKQQEILMQNFFNPDWNNNIGADAIFLQKKQHLINNAFIQNFNQNRLKNNLIDPLNYNHHKLKNSNQFNLDLLMYVLGRQLQIKGLKLYENKSSDQLNILSLQASFAYGLDNTTCLQLIIKNNKDYSYFQLQDEKKLKLFQSQIKTNLAYLLKIRPEDITLLQIEEGSIKIFFIVTNEAGVKQQIQVKNSINQIQKIYPDAQLVLNKYFQKIQLSAEDFDPQYNMEWSHNGKQFELRGPLDDKIKYFFPTGWKGYALNVKGKYDEGNDDWLKMDGNPNQWHIMYHGTKQNCVKGILQKGLQTTGSRQQFQDSIDKRTKMEKIGIGAYFSNHIEVAEQFADPIKFNGSKPEALKQIVKKSDLFDKRGNRDWDDDYFVVNKSEDIRPYRILLKKENQNRAPKIAMKVQSSRKKKKRCVIF